MALLCGTRVMNFGFVAADSDEFSRLYRFEISHHSEIKSPGSAANLAGNILWH